MIIPPEAYNHDVQVLPDGSLFVYRNFANGVRSVFANAPMLSAIQIYEYPSMNIKFSYGDKPEERFYSKFWGGGSVLPNGDVVFTDIDSDKLSINYFSLENRKNKKIFIGENKCIYNIQQVKYRNLNNFLANNKWNELTK
jgi:hypothetical protein